MRAGSVLAVRLLAGGVFGLATACASGNGGSNGLTITTVFRSGDPAPGLPGLTIAARGGAQSINDAGVVLATANLGGPDVGFSTDGALIARSGGVLTLIARENDPVAALPTHAYRSTNINTTGFSELIVTQGGTLGFMAEMLEVATSSFGLRGSFSGPVGGTAPVLYEGAPAPGFPGSTYSRYTPRASLRDGRSLLLGRVSPENYNVLYFGTPGNVTAALQTQQQAPGLPIGINISSFGDDSMGMDGLGNVLFWAALPLGSGVNQSNRVVLYHGPPNNVGIVARTGDSVPGLGGAVFTNLVSDSLRMNTAGAYCYQAWVSGGGTDEAIISCGGGQCFVLAKDGDPVPGEPGLTLDRVARSHIDMNGLGRVAFACVLAGAPFTSDSAIFIAGPGGIEMVLREGDVMPDGAVVRDLQGARWFFNDREQFVVQLTVNDRAALYASRPDGSWIKLLRMSEAFFTSDGFSGVLHPTAGYSFDFAARSGSGSGTSFFNNSGELVLSVLATGSTGSGVFILDIDDPCPADFAEPLSVLNFFDIAAYIGLYGAGDDCADFAAPFGVLNFFDISAYITAYNAGCPD